MYKKSKRFLAGFLAFLLVVTMVPSDMLSVVYAEEAEEIESQVLEDTDTDDAVLEDAEEAEVLEITEPEENTEEALEVNYNLKEGESETPSQQASAPAPSQPTITPEPSQPTITPEPSQQASEPASDPQPTEEKTYKLDFSKSSEGAIADGSKMGDENYFTIVQRSGKECSFKKISGVKKNVINADANTICWAGTGGGMQGNGNDPLTYGPSISFTSKTKKASVVVKFVPKNDNCYIVAATSKSGNLTNVTYTIDGVEGTATKGYNATGASNIPVLTETFTLAGEAKTPYYIGYDSNGGIILSIEVTEIPDVAVQTISDVELSMSGVSDFAETKKAPYTGADRIPGLTVKAGSTTLTASDYKVAYARKAEDTELTDDDYKEAKDVDLTSLGTIYVKVSSNSVDYNGSVTTSYEIVKGEAPAEQSKEEVVDVSKASDTEKSNDSMAYEVDLNTLFTFDKKYGPATYENAKIEDAGNVLDSSVQPAIKAETASVLTFNSKVTVPDSQQKAVIKVDAVFENYEKVTLTLEVTLSEKKAVTITGITVANKTYNGVAIAPNVEELSIKEGSNELKDTLANELVYTYAVKNGESLGTEAPKNAGTYTLVVSVPSGNDTYSGTTASIEFTIAPAPLTITVKNRTWLKDYATPGATAPKGEEASWYEMTDLVNNETLESLEATITFAYKEGEADVDWATVAKGADVDIVPVASGLDNYDITVVGGKLTIDAEEPLKSNEHELNFSKTTPQDTYFTVTGGLKSVVESGKQLVYYGKYTKAWKGDSSSNIKFNAPSGSKVELIYYLADSGTEVGVDGTRVTQTSEGTGTPADPTKGDVVAGCPVYKGTATVSTNGEHIIKRNNSTSEFQVYYVKVTEPSGGDDPDEVTINASTTGVALPEGANVYFVAGNDKIPASSATVLTVGTTYTLEVLDADGNDVEGYSAKYGASDTYRPAATDTEVSITISKTTVEPPVGTTLKLTFMNGDQKIHEEELEMSDPKEGVRYELAQVASKVIVPEDKEFLGWDLSSAAKEIVYSPEGIIRFRTNRTLYAVIADKDAKIYKVTFEDEYGEEMDVTSVLDGGTITFDESYNDKENHVFAGWKLQGDEDPDKVYKVGETYTVTKDVTFVETWKIQEYTVTLTDESGKVTKTEKVEAGKEFTFPETAPTKEGYTFAGWKSEYDDSVYNTGSKCVITEDITFKETWAQPNKEDFTVKFIDRDDNEITELTQTVKAGDDPVITLPKPLTDRIGYEFTWEDYDNGYSYKPGTSYVVTKNVTFYEGWEEEYYEKGMYIWLDDEEIYYQGGTAVTPDVTVYYNEEELTLGTDYTVKYKNNKNAGTATLTVTGKNNFAKADKKDVRFTIRRKDIANIDDYASEMTVIKDAKVNPVIIYNGKQLKLGKDFTISGTGLDTKGKYTAVTGKDDAGKPIQNKLTVTGINNFRGSFDINVTVVDKKDAPGLAVEIDKNFKPVYGDALTWATLFGKTETVNDQTVTTPGKITVYEKGDKSKKALVENTDFQVVTVSGDLSEACTYKFMVVGIGKYTGNVTKSFKISPKPLGESDIQVGVYDTPTSFKTTDLTAEYSSTGSTVKGLKVRYKTSENADNPTYTEMDSRNYKISYSGNKKVGTGKAKVTFVNDYKGTKAKTVEFTITGASLNSIDAIAPDMVYSKAGKAYVSKPIVEYDGTIIKASEYTVSYAWATEAKCKDEKGKLKAYKDITDWTDDQNKVKITLDDNDTYALVKVTITPSAKSNFILTKKDTANTAVPETTYYHVRKADTNAIDLTKAKVEFFADAKLTTPLKKIPYCGEKFYTPEGNKVSNVDGDGAVYVKVTVKVGKTEKVVDPSLYEVTWLNATNKGKATVVIVGNGPEESSGTPAEGTAKEFAIGSKTASATIDSIGRWVPPSNPLYGNFLKNIFGE